MKGLRYYITKCAQTERPKLQKGQTAHITVRPSPEWKIILNFWSNFYFEIFSIIYCSSLSAKESA